MLMRLIILLPLLLAPAVRAAELHADGAVDMRIGLGRKWDVVLHNRARVRAASNDWYDVSLVPIFRYQARPNLQLSGGTFATWLDVPAVGWRHTIRPFAGMEPSLRQGSLTVASRTGYERFLVLGGSDFNRYRQRFRIIGNRSSWTPYANIEFLLTNDGLSSTRYGAGARKDIGPHSGVEFSYWYEASGLAGTGVRHMISATLHVRFKGLAPDF